METTKEEMQERIKELKEEAYSLADDLRFETDRVEELECEIDNIKDDTRELKELKAKIKYDKYEMSIYGAVLHTRNIY